MSTRDFLDENPGNQMSLPGPEPERGMKFFDFKRNKQWLAARSQLLAKTALLLALVIMVDIYHCRRLDT